MFWIIVMDCYFVFDFEYIMIMCWIGGCGMYKVIGLLVIVICFDGEVIGYVQMNEQGLCIVELDQQVFCVLVQLFYLCVFKNCCYLCWERKLQIWLIEYDVFDLVFGYGGFEIVVDGFDFRKFRYVYFFRFGVW